MYIKSSFIYLLLFHLSLINISPSGQANLHLPAAYDAFWIDPPGRLRISDAFGTVHLVHVGFMYGFRHERPKDHPQGSDVAFPPYRIVPCHQSAGPSLV